MISLSTREELFDGSFKLDAKKIIKTISENHHEATKDRWDLWVVI